MTIKVSVIITFFSKQTGYLLEAVNSALNQSFHEIEVLVIDDCSPLKARDELASIKDNRLNVVENSENLGMARSINKGIAMSKGEYIAFLDFDDVWFNHKLEKQFNLINSVPNDQKYKTVIYSQAQVEDRGGTYIKPRFPIKEGERVGDYLFCRNELIQTSGLFLSKRAAVAVGGMSIFKRHTDYQFCLALEQFGCQFIMLEGASYRFRIVPKINDYQFSIEWLRKYKDLMTGNAIKAFQVNVILRSMLANRRYIKALYYSIVHSCTIKFIKFFTIHILKLILPEFVLGKLISYKNEIRSF